MFCRIVFSSSILQKTQCLNLSRRYKSCLLQAVQLSRRNISSKQLHKFRTHVLKTKPASVSKQNLINQNKSKSEIRQLLQLAAPEKWRLSGGIVFLVISSVVTMAVPFCIGKIIDIMYTNDKEKVQENPNRVYLIFMCIFLIGGICNFARVYLMSTTGYRITQALRKKVYASILSQETSMFDKVNTGELVGRLTGDAQLVSSAITSNISDGLRSTIMTSAGISMMFLLSPQLALVSLSIVPLVVGLAIIYGRFVKKISKDLQNCTAVLNTTAEEKISNIRTVKSFAQEFAEINRYGSKVRDLLDLCYKESFYRGLFFGLTGLSGNAIILSVLYYGSGMVSTETITVGNLTSFLLYAAYVGISINGLSSFYSELNKALGASTRLFELIGRQPAIPIKGGKILQHDLTGEISFEKIIFAYPARKEAVILKDFNLYLPKHTITAIVGPSGSGKSTVALLLLRLYDPANGSIRLDGHDLRELDPQWVKAQIGVVSQEPVLFDGTIRDNIIYGMNEVTENQVMEAAKVSNILEFIKKMKNGIDTIVGERGVTLSGGQRQRVAIARALIKNPKILILDEATSALDAESEKYVQEALERASKGRTVLTIAHRLSTIRHADRIAVLKYGKIIEYGTYDELMTLSEGLFKKLVKHQTFG